jgi:hypothetical protein
MSTLIELVHEGQRILVDGQTQKLDRFAGRCAAWDDKVEGALQDDPLALSRFRQAERSTLTPPGIPISIMGEWQITRGRVDALMMIAGNAVTSKRETRRFWFGLLVGIVIGAIGIFLAFLALPSERIAAIRAAVQHLFGG